MTESDPVASAPAPPAGEIIAPRDSWFFRKWLGISLVVIGFGGYFLYDGYVGWPRANAEQIALGRKPEHTDTDLALQKIIGYSLIPVGLWMLLRTLRNTRGQYRLTEDNTLHVPGHPPVPLDAIRSIDEAKWDRKGLAFIEYELNGKSGTVRLDDFAYERTPTDHIHDRLVAAIVPPSIEST
jgi:hypothetical protein